MNNPHKNVKVVLAQNQNSAHMLETALLLLLPFLVNFSVAISREVEYNEVMTKKQHEIIVGTLLGDAWIDRKCLRIKQSEAHKDYVFWLYSHF